MTVIRVYPKKDDHRQETRHDPYKRKRRIIIIAIIANLLAIIGIGLGFGLWLGLPSPVIADMFNSKCSSTQPCSAQLNCMNELCSCPSTNYYWSGSACALKKNLSDPCLNSNECNGNYGLSCNSSDFCDCATGFYLDGSICAPQKHWLESCTGSNECLTSGNLTCVNNTCLCPSTDYHYWSTLTNTCQLRGTFRDKCTNTSECLEINNLFCPSTNAASSIYSCSFNVIDICQCAPNMYYNGKTKSCVTIGSYNLTCTRDCECDQSVGLSCNNITGTCACPTSYVWTSGRCATCPTGWTLNMNNAHCVIINVGTFSWDNAILECQTLSANSTLISINDNLESAFLKDLYISNNITVPIWVRSVAALVGTSAPIKLFFSFLFKVAAKKIRSSTRFAWLDTTIPSFIASYCGGVSAIANLPVQRGMVGPCLAVKLLNGDSCYEDRNCIHTQDGYACELIL